MLYRGNDRARLARRAEIARQAGVPLIAVNDVLYHHPDRRELQDVLTCIREHLTIDQRRPAARRQCRALSQAARRDGALFRARPGSDRGDTWRSIGRSPSRSTSSVTNIPMKSSQALRHRRTRSCIWPGKARARAIPTASPDRSAKVLDHELALIASAATTRPIFSPSSHRPLCPRQNILCQGRGSAANSAVCYCLAHHRSVDPRDGNLLFERFISSDRDEPPDIDVDFEHERREEVIQYIYGNIRPRPRRHRRTVISYRGRSAIREVGKVFGLSEDTIGALSSSIWGMGGGSVRDSRACARRHRRDQPAHDENARARRWRSNPFRAISPSTSAASS